jgi:hypothetical protein
MMNKSRTRPGIKSTTLGGIALLLFPLLTSCGSGGSENAMANEFAFINYSSHAAECGMDQLYDVSKYSNISRGSGLDSTSDSKLLDKYPDIFKYDGSFDSWTDYMASETAPYEQERADAIKCKSWLDGLTISAPKDTKYSNAWSIVDEKISTLKTIVDARVQLFDEMYKLLPYKASDKNQRDKFYGIVDTYEKGRRLAYEGHIAVRQILESSKSNGLDYWLATCPTYIQITDLYGQNIVTSEDGILKIWNNTESEKTFSGTVHFKNAGGVEVASQVVDVTLPAGKSFDQTLKAVEGNDDYTGLPYPAHCFYTAS